MFCFSHSVGCLDAANAKFEHGPRREKEQKPGLKRNVENSFQNGKGKPKRPKEECGLWKTAIKMAKVSLKRTVENSFHNGKGKPKRRKLAKKSRSQALRGMWKTAFKMAKVSLEDAKSRNTYDAEQVKPGRFQPNGSKNGSLT